MPPPIPATWPPALPEARRDPRTRIGITGGLLLAVNLGIAVYALTRRFGYAELLLAYWAETVIVGILAVPKLLIVALFGRKLETIEDARDATGRTAAVVLMLIFATALFAVLCMLLYAAIVFLPRALELADHDAGPSFSRTLRTTGFRLGEVVAALAASHAASFFINFLYGREFRGGSVLALAAQPFLRTAKIIALIVLALAVAFFQPVLSRTTAFALVVIGAKIALDLHAHLAERRRFAGTMEAPPALPAGAERGCS